MSQGSLESTVQLRMSVSTSASWDYRIAVHPHCCIPCWGPDTGGLVHAKQAGYQLSQIPSAKPACFELQFKPLGFAKNKGFLREEWPTSAGL